MRNNILNTLGLLLIVVACTVTCSNAEANNHEHTLAELCQFHGVRYCPVILWVEDKPDQVKDAKIACGYTAKRERVCAITIWPGADPESLRHEFAHFLTWLRASDGRTGEFKHGGAYKRARSAVGVLPEFVPHIQHGAGGCTPNHSTGGCL